MSWIKVDDQFFSDPRVMLLGKDAKLLHLAAKCYCGAHLTDGLITAAALRFVAMLVEAADPPSDLASTLVSAGLWSAGPDGSYVLVDYLPEQRTREEVLLLKNARAEAGRIGGQHSGEARRAKHEANEANPEAIAYEANEANGKQNRSKRASKIEANANQIDQIRSDPDQSARARPDLITDNEANEANPEAIALTGSVSLGDWKWWQDAVVERARAENLPLEEFQAFMAARFSDESQRHTDSNKPSRPSWRNWMKRALDFGVRDFRAKKGVSLNGHGAEPAYREDETTKRLRAIHARWQAEDTRNDPGEGGDRLLPSAPFS